MEIVTLLVSWVLEDETVHNDVYVWIRALLDQGYTPHEIDTALTFVFTLPDILLSGSTLSSESTQATRVFSLSERIKLDVSAQGYLLRLVDEGFLTQSELEEIVNAAMCLDVEEVGISELQWLLSRMLQDSVRSTLFTSGSQSNQPH